MEILSLSSSVCVCLSSCRGTSAGQMKCQGCSPGMWVLGIESGTCSKSLFLLSHLDSPGPA